MLHFITEFNELLCLSELLFQHFPHYYWHISSRLILLPPHVSLSESGTFINFTETTIFIRHILTTVVNKHFPTTADPSVKLPQRSRLSISCQRKPLLQVSRPHYRLLSSMWSVNTSTLIQCASGPPHCSAVNQTLKSISAQRGTEPPALTSTLWFFKHA